jgi:hypothetical protein
VTITIVYLLGAFGLTACSTQPDVQEVIEVTRIVTELEQNEVTRLVEVEVQVTRVVELPVEVTRVVEVERLVTPTPLPATPTPRAPEQGLSDNPYPVGTTIQMITGDSLEFDFTVLEILRGDEAWQRVRAANQFNDAPEPGKEYLMVKVAVEYTGRGPEILELDESDVELVSEGRIYDWFAVDDACCLDPSFDFVLLPGAYAEGWFAWLIPPDPNAMLKLGTAYFSLSQVTQPESSQPGPESSQTASQNTATTGQSAGQLDLASFTDTWLFGDDDVQIIYRFFEDGTYELETIATLELEGFPPQTIRNVIEGTWEYQDGITVCLSSETVGATCSEWYLDGDSLRRGDDPSLFLRQES